MADELNTQEAGGDTHLDEIHKAFEKDNENGKRIGQVWKLSQQELDATKIAEELKVPTSGFVFSYRTYLKVGRSKNNAIKRFRDQRGSTALPEPPILLRIYVGSNGMDIEEVEKKVHRHLAAADHVRNSERGAGQEWFLTHLKFLDSTAELLDLKTHFAIDDSDDD